MHLNDEQSFIRGCALNITREDMAGTMQLNMSRSPRHSRNGGYSKARESLKIPSDAALFVLSDL